jgi:hypothetical protein
MGSSSKTLTLAKEHAAIIIADIGWLTVSCNACNEGKQ